MAENTDYTLQELTEACFSGSRLRDSHIRVVAMEIVFPDTPERSKPYPHGRSYLRRATSKEGLLMEFELRGDEP